MRFTGCDALSYLILHGFAITFQRRSPRPMLGGGFPRSVCGVSTGGPLKRDNRSPGLPPERTPLILQALEGGLHRAVELVILAGEYRFREHIRSLYGILLDDLMR